MKNSIQPVAVLLALLFANTAFAQTGELRIRFEFDGDVPEQKEVDVTKDIQYCGKHKLMDETLLVHQENKGVKNVIVYVYTGKRGSKLEPVAPVGKTHTLANDQCRFEPHIVIAQTGDTLKVTNPDEVGHNANLSFFNNKEQNLMIPSGQEKDLALKEAEPAPIPVECNIHPWMRAYIVVLEHPFVAASDENGELTIKGLPVGEELVFRAYHESCNTREVKIKGRKKTWKGSKFEVEIEPGMNDFGTVMIEKLKPR